MSLLPVSIIITTFDRGSGDRTALAMQTVNALLTNLKYPELYWLIADNGSPKHDEQMLLITKDLPKERTTVLNTTAGGVGASKNAALKHAFETVSPMVLLLEDDWLLKYPLYIEKDVQLILDHEDVGMIRYGYLGGELDAHYTDYGIFKTYWTLIRGSGVYIYSGQVSLRHKRFYDAVGYHHETETPGEEELEMCKRFNGVDNAPKILWPAEYATVMNGGPFNNIGLGFSMNAGK